MKWTDDTYHSLFVWIGQKAVNPDLAVPDVAHIKPQVEGPLLFRAKASPRVVPVGVLFSERTEGGSEVKKIKLKKKKLYHQEHWNPGSCFSKSVEKFPKEGTVWVQLKQTPGSKAKRQMLQTSWETLRCSTHHYMCHIIWQGVDCDSSTLRGPAHPPQRRFVASVTSMWLWGHAVQVTCEENGTSVSLKKKKKSLELDQIMSLLVSNISKGSFTETLWCLQLWFQTASLVRN